MGFFPIEKESVRGNELQINKQNSHNSIEIFDFQVDLCWLI